MRVILLWIDEIGGIETKNRLAKTLERAAFVFLILMFVCAPHSIAATQTAWLTGMFLWFVRLFIKPRPPLVRTPLDVPLWTFFGWSLVTSIFSYDPLTSLDKLRLNPALFLIFYYVINVVKNKRAAVFLASAMIFSCLVSVVWTPIERVFGRGVQIVGTSPASPLTKAILFDGDTLLKANKRKIKTPEDLVEEIETNETTKITVYRPDYDFTVDVPRANLLGGANALEKLGISSWKRSHNWRSAGFYGHYTTFAEVLQLIASLTFGLFIAAFIKEFLARKSDKSAENSKRKVWILGACVAGMAFALLLTVTRASQLGFLISAFTIVLLTGNRKIFLMLAAVALPVALLGLIFLQQSRQVGFFDANDNSIKDRQTFYRKGFDLWTENARNFTLGVGMDSTKRYIKEWNLYDNDGKPMGHFHSTPLQLLVERGLPALLLWLWVLWIYGRTLRRYLKFRIPDSRFQIPDIEKSERWRETGIILGSFGGMIGFTAGGMVHYNLGDAEVAMVFFMLMGISVSITNYELRMKTAILTFVIRNLKFAYCFKLLARCGSGRFSYTDRGGLSRVRRRRARCSSGAGRGRF